MSREWLDLAWSLVWTKMEDWLWAAGYLPESDEVVFLISYCFVALFKHFHLYTQTHHCLSFTLNMLDLMLAFSTGSVNLLCDCQLSKHLGKGISLIQPLYRRPFTLHVLMLVSLTVTPTAPWIHPETSIHLSLHHHSWQHGIIYHLHTNTPIFFSFAKYTPSPIKNLWLHL